MENRHFSLAPEKVYAKLHKGFCDERGIRIAQLVCYRRRRSLRSMDSKGAIPNLVSVFFRRLVVLIVLRVDAIKKRNLTWHRRFRRDGTAQSKYYDCLHRSHRKVFIAMMLIRGIFSVRLGKRSPGFNLSRGALAALGLLVICGSLEFAVAPNARANDPRDPWFFTAKEVQAAYQYQENYGGRIRYPLRPEACFLGREEFVLSHEISIHELFFSVVGIRPLVGRARD